MLILASPKLPWFATILSRVYIGMQTECECSMWKQCKRSMQTYSWGEANSIRLCDECSANSWMLSAKCRYFKRNSHTIHLDIDVIFFFFFTFGNERFTNSLGTGSIRCLSECWTMYKFTYINVRIIFACCVHVLFAFRCKSGFTQTFNL